jgi:hypothetical protein
MTAQVFTASVKPASLLSTCKAEAEGNTKLDATAVTALAALTTANRIENVIDILSACAARANVVTASSIGLATSVKA